MNEQPSSCPFCSPYPERIVGQNAMALALLDAFPVVPGHTLVVSRRHVADYFELSPAEQAGVWELVNQVRARLAAESAPDGYNIGVNAGPAAGQTIGHAHVHVIPRGLGDRDDPRGGIRWIFPERAQYWPEDRAADRASPGDQG